MFDKIELRFQKKKKKKKTPPTRRNLKDSNNNSHSLAEKSSGCWGAQFEKKDVEPPCQDQVLSVLWPDLEYPIHISAGSWQQDKF